MKIKRITLCKVAKWISWIALIVIIANFYFQSNLVRQLALMILTIALCLIVLDDSKTNQSLLKLYQKQIVRTSKACELPDRISDKLRESDFDEDSKEKFNAMIWEAYFDIMQEMNE